MGNLAGDQAVDLAHRVLFQLMRGKPGNSLVFAGADPPGFESAIESMHAHGEVGVGMAVDPHFLADLHFDIQFFTQFPPQPFFERFAFFQLTTGEFPHAGQQFAFRAAGEQVFAITADDRGSHFVMRDFWFMLANRPSFLQTLLKANAILTYGTFCTKWVLWQADGLAQFHQRLVEDTRPTPGKHCTCHLP